MEFLMKTLQLKLTKYKSDSPWNAYNRKKYDFLNMKHEKKKIIRVRFLLKRKFFVSDCFHDRNLDSALSMVGKWIGILWHKVSLETCCTKKN